jgi:signal transduction histidine kinase
MNTQEKKQYSAWRSSVQLKFSMTLMALILVLIAIVNTYPVLASRNLVFTSKEASLGSQASVMSSTLSALESLNEENVGQVMDLLDVTSLSRVIVTDDTGLVLYDTSSTAPSVGSFALFSEIARALGGEVVFYSRYTGDAFMSRSAIPVGSRGGIIGAVYLYEYDEDSAQLVQGLQSNLRNVSIIVAMLAVVMVLFSTRALTKRLTELVSAMKIVSQGDYEYRMDIKGDDEVSELGYEFNNLTQRLQSTEEARRRFVSDASHELKTPLASIRLLADSIVQNENMDTATMREFALDISEEAERLQRISEKLLSLTRLDSEAEIVWEPVDVKTVAEKTLHLLEPLAQENGVSLEYSLADDCVIIGNGDNIFQIIFNLAENAIKYNVRGGLVRLLLYRQNDEVSLIVDDTGIGIPDEDMPHVFSRFYRVDKARSRATGGSGLGLSIVKDAVTAHGGTIELSHREPSGTRAIVTFPAMDEEEVRQ